MPPPQSPYTNPNIPWTISQSICYTLQSPPHNPSAPNAPSIHLNPYVTRVILILLPSITCPPLNPYVTPLNPHVQFSSTLMFHSHELPSPSIPIPNQLLLHIPQSDTNFPMIHLSCFHVPSLCSHAPSLLSYYPHSPPTVPPLIPPHAHYLIFFNFMLMCYNQLGNMTLFQ